MKDPGPLPLLERARKRDPEALAALCEQFYPKVLKYMHYRVGASDAGDLAGEVFLRVMRSIESQSGSFEAWLYRLAANVIIDWARHSKVRQETSMDGEVVKTLAVGGDPAEGVTRQADLARAIGQLTADQREFVTLKFVQGLSNAEIGTITGRKPEALRALQFRALSALRKIMEGQGGE